MIKNMPINDSIVGEYFNGAGLWGNSLKQLVLALAVLLAAMLVLRVFKGVIISRLKALSKKTSNQLDDIVMESINSISWPFYVLVSLYAGLQILNLPQLAGRMIFFVFIICIAYYAVKFLEDLAEFGFNKIIEKRKEEDQSAGIIGFLRIMTKIFLWLGAGVLVVSNMGYDVTSLIAGLGIGGIAVALALQNILGDLFSSFAIYFDKPFKIGDFVIVGSDMGTVKKVGIKTTRIETLEGQELVVSNSELTAARINNYGRMEKRRVVFSFGVTYDTPKKKLEKIPSFVKGIIDEQEGVEFDRAHFKSFGESSLLYEVVYYRLTGDYNQYMDTQQDINLALVGKFEEEGIEFAFPTQTIHLKK